MLTSGNEGTGEPRMEVAMAVEAVIFDWGGTLTPWHTVDPAQVWVGATDDDAELAARLIAAEDHFWDRSRDEHLSFTLDDIFEHAAFRPSESGLSAYHAFWDEHTFTDPAVPAVFSGLRDRGIKIGVLSNTTWPRSRHEEIFRRDGVLELIDAAVYTSEIPYNKPHPEAFRTALAAVGVAEPERAVFVGDRLFDDVHGAKNVGMRAVYVPHSEIPPRQLGPTEGEPDAVVHDLSELLAIVDRWS